MLNHIKHYLIMMYRVLIPVSSSFIYKTLTFQLHVHAPMKIIMNNNVVLRVIFRDIILVFLTVALRLISHRYYQKEQPHFGLRYNKL